MNASTRRAVAYIAGGIVAQFSRSHVYDHDASEHFAFSGAVGATSCNTYDHDRGCHITGSPPQLYDHGNQKHLTLEVKGQAFSGYDFDSQQHFSGRVNGSSITLYDHGDGAHHNYSI